MKIRFIILMCIIINITFFSVAMAFQSNYSMPYLISSEITNKNDMYWSKSLNDLKQKNFFMGNNYIGDFSDTYWGMTLNDFQQKHVAKYISSCFEGTSVYRVTMEVIDPYILVYFQNNQLYKMQIRYSSYEGLSYEENIKILTTEYGTPQYNNGIEAIWKKSNVTIVFNDNGGTYDLIFFDNRLLKSNFKYEHKIEHRLTFPSNVTTGSQVYTNLDLKYPLVYMNNLEVQNKINTDIAKYVYEFKSDYDNGLFYNGWTRYEIKYEDNQYLSLILFFHRYNLGAAHGMYYAKGLTYDKNTGNIIPLNNFVPKIQINDLNSLAINVYNQDMLFLPNHLKVKNISDNYYLGGNGVVYLIYQPYVLSGFGDGIVSLELTPEVIDYFNRKNNY